MDWLGETKGRRLWAGLVVCLGGLVLLTQVAAAQPLSGRNPGVEVRRLGLSRVGENTLLTLVLNRKAEPRISSRYVAGRPQLVVDFPQARLAEAPTRLAGDDLLVAQVVTETAGSGVRIVLDLFPDQPYVYWHQSRPSSGGQTIFMVGLKADRSAPPPQAQQMPPPESAEPSWTPKTGKPYVTGEEGGAPPPPPAPPEAGPAEPRYPEPGGAAASASFPELRRLIPQAAALLQGLETEGWAISQSRNYNRPGQRFSQDFILTNPRYPELSVKIAYLPANAPNTPNISILELSTDRLSSEEATQYRELRQWNFAKIKQKYEDIGDFFDDALKPLRVKLRNATKSLVLRDAQVFENFVRRATPDPKVAQTVMVHVREKVSPRFEGVQYTVSERPLIILNMVDFLYIKVYFIGPG
jgi:hypothetical protein